MSYVCGHARIHNSSASKQAKLLTVHSFGLRYNTKDAVSSKQCNSVRKSGDERQQVYSTVSFDDELAETQWTAYLHLGVCAAH
jgi:hypothetical protein